MHLSVLLTTIFVLLPCLYFSGRLRRLPPTKCKKNVFVTIPPTRVNRQIGDDPRRLPTQRGALIPLEGPEGALQPILFRPSDVGCSAAACPRSPATSSLALWVLRLFGSIDQDTH